MTSEHHGGFSGYLPNPLQMATFVLEENPTGWAAACPLLLPLRATALVAEEVAWLAARHPGRVGVGVAAGALPLDFALAGVSMESAVPIFKAELPRLVAMLCGQGLGDLAGDPALARCAEFPVPVLSAAASTTAAKRAARCGAGMVMEGMSTAERLAPLSRAFDAAGGTGTKVLIRRVWLGEPSHDLVVSQRAVYDSYARPARAFGDDETIAAADPSEVAERLAEVMAAAGANALNLRVHLPGVTPEVAREQIIGLGEAVVPRLKALVAAAR